MIARDKFKLNSGLWFFKNSILYSYLEVCILLQYLKLSIETKVKIRIYQFFLSFKKFNGSILKKIKKDNKSNSTCNIKKNYSSRIFFDISNYEQKYVLKLLPCRMTRNTAIRTKYFHILLCELNWL